MHHRCSSGSQGNMVGPCSCGVFHSQTSSSFSMFFSMPNNHHRSSAVDEYSTEMHPFTSSLVDCTLSLGTPSTRLTSEEEQKRRRPGSCMSNFCWDIFQAKQQNPTSTTHAFHKATRSGNTNSSITTNSVNDSLLARRCANCDTTSTPLWRNGPRGPKSLCNACGIRFKKEERRASAAAATTTANHNATAGVMDHQNMMSAHQNDSWVHNSQTTSQKMPCYGNEFRFIDDDDRNQDNGVSFLSWRLNVTDRPSLVHDFTR
ncbi:Zinc finger, GATA-type [Dillenia turbinata]|uniref:Zinc finger, GATA-type n=1 Tax=Dillenia turbinata TaxID=194707 RepID=A0AAN8Z8F7_9MAGN